VLLFIYEQDDEKVSESKKWFSGSTPRDDH
jgi:hypothetical protein